MTTTLPIDPALFWFLVTLAGIVLFSGLIYAALPSAPQSPKTAELKLKTALGAAGLPQALFLLLALLWAVLAGFLLVGLIATNWSITREVATARSFRGPATRLPLIQLAALTATLGATVALPFTVIRLKLTNEQTQWRAWAASKGIDIPRTITPALPLCRALRHMGWAKTHHHARTRSNARH